MSFKAYQEILQRTVAITPRQAKEKDFDEVRRVCHDYALSGLEAVFKAYSESASRSGQPLRFMVGTSQQEHAFPAQYQVKSEE